MCLSEEDVRRIVREEMRSLLVSLVKTSDRLNVPYETEEIENRILRSIGKVADQEASHLPHKWDCGSRDPDWMKINPFECTCGVGE